MACVGEMEEVSLIKRSVADLSSRLDRLAAGQDQTMMLLEAAAASERQLLLRIDQLESFSAHAGAAGDQVSMVLGHMSADLAALQARLSGVEQALRRYHTSPAPPSAAAAAIAGAASAFAGHWSRQGGACFVSQPEMDLCQAPEQQQQRQQYTQRLPDMPAESEVMGVANPPNPASALEVPLVAAAAPPPAAAAGSDGSSAPHSEFQPTHVQMPAQAAVEDVATGAGCRGSWPADEDGVSVDAGSSSRRSSRSSSGDDSPMSATRRSLTAAFDDAADAPSPGACAADGLVSPGGSGTAGECGAAAAGGPSLEASEVLGDLSRDSSSWCGFDQTAGVVAAEDSLAEGDKLSLQQQLVSGKQTGGSGPKQHTPIRWRSNQLSDMAARSDSPGAATASEPAAAAAAAGASAGLGSAQRAESGGSSLGPAHSMGQLEGTRYQEVPPGGVAGAAAGAGRALMGQAAQQQVAASSAAQPEGAGDLLHRLLERVQQLEAQQQQQQQSQKQQTLLLTHKDLPPPAAAAPAPPAAVQQQGEPAGDAMPSSSNPVLSQMLAAAVLVGALWGRQDMTAQQGRGAAGLGQAAQHQEQQEGRVTGQAAVQQQDLAEQLQDQDGGQQQQQQQQQSRQEQAAACMKDVCQQPVGSTSEGKECADTEQQATGQRAAVQDSTQAAQQQQQAGMGPGKESQLGGRDPSSAADRSPGTASQEATAAAGSEDATSADVAPTGEVAAGSGVQGQAPPVVVIEGQQTAGADIELTAKATAATAASAAVEDDAAPAGCSLQPQESDRDSIAAGGEQKSAIPNIQQLQADSEAEGEEESDTLPELFPVPLPALLRRVSAEVARPWERLPSERPQHQQAQGHGHHHHQQQQQQRRLSTSPDKGRSRAKPGWKSVWAAPHPATAPPASSSGGASRHGDTDTAAPAQYSSVRRSLQVTSSSGRSGGSGGGWCSSTKVTSWGTDSPAAGGEDGAHGLRSSQALGGLGSSSSSGGVRGGRDAARLLRASYAGGATGLDTAAAGRGLVPSRHRYDQDTVAASSSGMGRSNSKRTSAGAAAADVGAAASAERLPARGNSSGKTEGVDSEPGLGGGRDASKGFTVQQRAQGALGASAGVSARSSGSMGGRPGLRSHPLRTSTAVTCSDISLSQASSQASGISTTSRPGSKAVAAGAAAADAASGGRALQDQSSKQQKASGACGRAVKAAGGKVVLLSSHPNGPQQHRYVVAATTHARQGAATASSAARGPPKDPLPAAAGTTGGSSSAAGADGHAERRRSSTKHTPPVSLSSSLSLTQLGSLGGSSRVRHSIGHMGHMPLTCSPWAAAALSRTSHAAGGSEAGGDTTLHVQAAGGGQAQGSTSSSQAWQHTSASHAARVTPPGSGAAGGQGEVAGGSTAPKRAAWRNF